jgi:hypothetical protein
MIRKPVKMIVIWTLVSFSFTHCAKAFQENGFQVEAAGLAVFKPASEDDFRSMVIGQTAGTTVTVKLSSDTHHIIQFGDREQVKLTITDDKEEKLSEFRDTQAKYFQFQVADDGKSAMFPVTGLKMPTPGATRLSVSGSLNVVTGSKVTTSESVMTLKKGKTGKFGNIACEVINVSSAYDREYKICVDIKSKQSLSAISKIEFVKASDGTTIGSRSGKVTHFSIEGSDTFMQPYYLKEDVADVKVKVTYFSETKTQSIPIELSIGLGLQ